MNNTDWDSILETENFVDALPKVTMHIDTLINLARRQAMVIDDLESSVKHYEALLKEYERKEDDHR